VKHEDKRLPGDVIDFGTYIRAGEVDMAEVQRLRRCHTAERLADLADGAYEEYWRTPWWKRGQRRAIAARRRTLMMAAQLASLCRWFDGLPVWNGAAVPGQKFYRSR